MASGSYVNDSNEELASKTSEQLSAIKSDDENVSDVGDPLESLESIDESIAQKNIEVKEDEASRANEYVSGISLSDLNEDCLYSVLRWLLLKNQVRVERVNTQWLRAVERCVNGQRAVVLSGARYYNSEETIYVADDKFEYFSQVVSRLTSLIAVHFCHLKLSSPQLCLLFDWKQPIESIMFFKCEIQASSSESWEEFAERNPFHSLKAAQFYYCKLDGDFLAMVFQKAGYNLKVLGIDKCSVSGSDPYKYLPDSVEKLVVGQEWSGKPKEIAFLKKNSACLPAMALKEADFNNVGLEQIQSAVSQMASLESLKLTYSCFSYPRINNDFLNGFRRLKALSIEFEDIFELKDIDSLQSFPELKYFKLRCRTTAAALAQLFSKMPNLASLNLELEVGCECEVLESVLVEEPEMWDIDGYRPNYCGGCLDDDYHCQNRTGGTMGRIDPRDDPCQQNFLQPLAVLSKLRSLEINRADEEGLAKLLDKGLLALRKLSIAHVSNAAVIQAFVKAAKAEPKKEFVLKWGRFSEIDVAHIDFPRNVRKPDFWENNRDFC